MPDERRVSNPCVVVSQPMYFPWIGLLEQIRLCDIFVYYNDVQFARGFYNRVQIKTNQGIRWLTVPLLGWRRGQLINEVSIDNTQDWKRNHRDQLRHAYAAAPFRSDMLTLVDEVFSRDYKVLGDLAQASIEALLRYFPALGEGKSFLLSSDLNIPGSSSRRLVDICLTLNAKTYLTGHGAKNYLEHEKFESKGIKVEYIHYELEERPQLHGSFTPYVSALDLIANCGPDAIGYVLGRPQSWQSFLAAPQKMNKE